MIDEYDHRIHVRATVGFMAVLAATEIFAAVYGISHSELAQNENPSRRLSTQLHECTSTVSPKP